MNGHLDVLHFNLDNGLDVNEEDSDRRTLLHYTYLKGQASVVDDLIGLSTDTDIGDFTLFRPISVAVSNGPLEILKILCSTGVLSEKKESKLPLMVAACNGNLDIVNYLIKERYYDINNISGD